MYKNKERKINYPHQKTVVTSTIVRTQNFNNSELLRVNHSILDSKSSGRLNSNGSFHAMNNRTNNSSGIHHIFNSNNNSNNNIGYNQNINRNHNLKPKNSRGNYICIILFYYIYIHIPFIYIFFVFIVQFKLLNVKYIKYL